MSILTRIYNSTLGRILSASVDPHDKVTAPTIQDLDEQPGRRIPKKRKELDEVNRSDGVISKKRRFSEVENGSVEDKATYVSNLMTVKSVTSVNKLEGDGNGDEERENGSLSPLPTLHHGAYLAYDDVATRSTPSGTLDTDSSSDISLSMLPSPDKATREDPFIHEMERARRHAIATKLPENSGIWERAEKELFFHLSYIGFEPLLPRDWFRDFRTMPLTIYGVDSNDTSPLIQALQDNGNFRAIKELRELLELGKTVRDRALVRPGARKEDVIGTAIKKYINWALQDARIKIRSPSMRHGPLPIHVIQKLKTRQTTTDALAELKSKMHDLRSQHFQARDILESIERDADGGVTPDSGQRTRLAMGSVNDISVIYGLLVINSLVAIFTLNSRVPSPGYMLVQYSMNNIRQNEPLDVDMNYGDHTESVTSTEANARLKRSLLTAGGRDEAISDSASDPRSHNVLIDFSVPAHDVWNALYIAIIAMQIRRDMTNHRLQDKTASPSATRYRDGDQTWSIAREGDPDV